MTLLQQNDLLQYRSSISRCKMLILGELVLSNAPNPKNLWKWKDFIIYHTPGLDVAYSLDFKYFPILSCKHNFLDLDISSLHFGILKPQKFWWLGCHRACVTAKPHNYYIRPKYLEIPTKHWQVIWSNEVLHAILDQRLFVHITHQRDILTWRVTTHLWGDNRMIKGHGKLIYVCLNHPINDYTQIVS